MQPIRLMHGWRRGGESRLRLRSQALFQLSRLFIDKTEQDVLAPHALAHVANARMFLFHPDIDKLLQRVHAIAATSTIKALKPVHIFVLSR